MDAQNALGETPEEFKNYWLSRFPLLLVHTWLSMQCVSHETSFSHYYTPVYKFSLLDSSSEQLEMNVVEELEDENLAVPVDEENLKYFSSKSPKKIRFNEKKMKRTHERNPVSAENKQENVGLYRNLKMSQENAETEVTDVNLKVSSTKDRFNKKSRSINWRHSAKVKQSKATEKPLTWAVSEMKTE